MRCYVLIMHRNNFIFYRVLIVPCRKPNVVVCLSYTAARYLLSCAYISQPQAICCCKLLMYCSKVSFIVCLYFPAASHMLLHATHVLQQGIFYCMLIFPSRKPYVVACYSCTAARYLLSCAYISQPQAICCCKLLMYCSKVSFIVCLYFPAASHMLLQATHVLQQGIFYRVLIFPSRKPYVVASYSCTAARYLLSCAYISQPQAICCCKLLMYCSKVSFIVCLYFPSDVHTISYANHVLQQCNLLACTKICMLQGVCCCMLIVKCSKAIFYRVFLCCKPYVIVCKPFTAERFILSRALVFLPCKSYNFVCLACTTLRQSLIVSYYFSATSPTLLFASHILYQGNLLSCANISLLTVIRSCMLRCTAARYLCHALTFLC